MTDNATPPWTVTSQREDYQVDENNSPTRGVIVYFRTGQGHNGSVFVPAAMYNPESVRRLIREKAANMDAVGRLTGA